jgi:hypothetical protein
LHCRRNPHYFDRPLHIHFLHRLLASGALTSDPEQADYFFFPISVRGPGEGRWLESAIAYVRHHLPYWDRHQGARHLVIHTGEAAVEQHDSAVRGMVRVSIAPTC